jgi:cob(I)alamin adenosyltransferase
MFSDLNNSVYSKNENTIVDIHKSNLTKINDTLFKCQFDGIIINIHSKPENITNQVLRFFLQEQIIEANEEFYILLDSTKIKLNKFNTYENNELDELNSLLEEYKSETESLKTFVNSKSKGKTLNLSKNLGPKR